MKEKGNMKNGIRIPTIQCKDLYNSNHLIKENESGVKTGFSLYYKTDQGRELNLKRFMSCLDYSLESIKLEEIYKKVLRKNGFFKTLNGKNYSTAVISVQFDYSLKEYNKAGRNCYVKTGYALGDLVFENGIAYGIDDEIAGVQVETVFDEYVDIEEMAPCFKIKDGKYEITSRNHISLKRAELREWAYSEGFYVDGIKYVRYKRSSGSSRVGKCLFLREDLYPRIHKWECCGLKIEEDASIDLAAFEAYIALTTSSIIDTIDIQSENILLIDDQFSIFKDEVIKVSTQDSKVISHQCITEIKNSLFDGESLVDVSLMGGYTKYGMILLRNRFFKSAAFNTNIQKFFADNGITDISQLNGKTLAKDIKDIKFITTPSSIKYLKFGTFETWLSNIDSTFGIVKHEKPTHFFDGRMVQSHYQLINTCELHKEDVNELLKPSLDYIYKLRTDPDVLKWHIRCPGVKDETKINQITDMSQATFRLMSINSKFKDTKLYRDFRKTLVKGQIRNLKQGHLLINGNYSTLLGNGYEMLLSSIGKFNGESEIGVGNIYCKNFAWNERILGSRSPHVCSGNIYLANNVYNENYDKYFNLTKEIVCVNSIGENTQQTLNG